MTLRVGVLCRLVASAVAFAASAGAGTIGGCIIHPPPIYPSPVCQYDSGVVDLGNGNSLSVRLNGLPPRIPVDGTTMLDSFFDIFTEVSLDGFPDVVTHETVHLSTTNAPQMSSFFDVFMEGLDFSATGGGGSGLVMIRESPTLPSHGQILWSLWAAAAMTFASAASSTFLSISALTVARLGLCRASSSRSTTPTCRNHRRCRCCCWLVASRVRWARGAS